MAPAALRRRLRRPRIFIRSFFIIWELRRSISGQAIGAEESAVVSKVRKRRFLAWLGMATWGGVYWSPVWCQCTERWTGGMICPQCKAEYRQGFTHCADCDVDLVWELPKAAIEVRPEEQAVDPNE